jgi:hypothetical protein
LGNGGSFRELDSAATMTAGQFRHVACTWNGTTLSLHIDGVLNASTAQNLTPTGNTSPLFIGQFGGNSDRLNGTIDEVRIYNRALTQAEIQFDMNTPIGGGLPSDTTPPTAPVSLQATATSSSEISLNWTASTDAGGVTGYQVERCQGSGCSNFGLVTTVLGTTYNNTGLLASTNYTYRVRAMDAVPNFSDYSNSASATTQASLPSQGLVAAYAFSEGLGTTTADTSGNANIGALTNDPTWTTQGEFGNAIAFDGVDDFITVADNATLDLSSGGTLSVWVRLNTINRWNSIIAKGVANNDAAHNYALEIDDGNRIRCILGNGAAFQVLASTPTIAADEFRHLACSWDGAVISLFIDGILNASSPQILTPAGNTASLFIGQFGGNSDRLDGVIDEVRIYNRALTEAEIQQDMNTPIQ